MDMRLDFQQQTSPELTVSGQLTLDGLKLHEKVNRTDIPLLELGGMDLKIDAWRPLEGVLKLETLSLDKPVLHTRRDATGELNWVRLQRFFMSAAPAVSAPNQASADYALKRLQIRAAQLHWQDAAVTMATPLALTELSIEGQDFSWPKFPGRGRPTCAVPRRA
jgi:uncharacterized protein involved in outer membrane biogenesis